MERLETKNDEGFATLSRAEILETFEKLLKEEPIESLRRTVDDLKIAFYRKPSPESGLELNSETETPVTSEEQNGEQANKTEEQEPNENEAKPSTPAPMEAFSSESDLDYSPSPEQQQYAAEEARFKTLIREYRLLRDKHIEEQDGLKDLNLKAKLQILAELKELAESDGTLGHSFNKLRELQQRWRDIGQIPQANLKDVWERYNLYTEQFYSIVKINRELRDLDLKKNLETKTALCEAAEALCAMEGVVEAFKSLQPLHDQWRETGPVDAENKELVWNRFKEASAIVNRRHLEYFEGLKAEQEKNLKLKTALCERVEARLKNLPSTNKEWAEASEDIQAIQSEWKSIGFAPKKDNAQIYNRLRTACDAFFFSKREFFADAKSDMDQNLAHKRSLCEQAEALSQSEDWKSAGEQLQKLQAEWKTAGAVSRRYSDQIWKRFRAACDTFFDRKSTHFASQNGEQSENLARKQELLKQMETSLAEGVQNVEQIKTMQRKWSEIGFVPIKQKEELQKQYKEIVDKLFAALRGSEKERNMENFRSRVGEMKSSGDGRMRGERERLTSKLKQIASEIALLENNIGFFAHSKGADAMIEDIKRKIERARTDEKELKEKIKMIDLAARSAE